jgi:hypothetical protein
VSDRPPLLVIEKDPWGGPYTHLARRGLKDPAELAGKWLVVLAGASAVDQKHVTEAFRAAKDAGVPLGVVPGGETEHRAWFGELEDLARLPRSLGVRVGKVALDVPGPVAASVLAGKIRGA